MPLSVGIISLGCAKNRVDTEEMLAVLQEAGYAFTGDPQAADILIVNTCAFIEQATLESIETLLEMSRYKQGRCRLLVAAGCLAERYREALLTEIPDLDAVIGLDNLERLVPLLRQRTIEKVFLPAPAARLPYLPRRRRVITTAPHSVYLKIAEGCNHRCSFCVIPRLRGPLRSKKIEDIIAEAEELAAGGVREINIVAQDTTAYGMDLYGRPMLAELLRALNGVKGVAWLRLLYTYPSHFSRSLACAIAELDKVCPYVDLPLQHSDDAILSRMRRPYRQARVRRLLAGLRAQIPGLSLRTTFIVGFPGEGEREFDSLLRFMQEERFHWAGIFAFSPEEGTAAAALPDQVGRRTRLRRLRRAQRLQKEIIVQHNRALVGRSMEALIDRFDAATGTAVGRTRHQAPGVDGVVIISGVDNAVPGELMPVRITGEQVYDLRAIPDR